MSNGQIMMASHSKKRKREGHEVDVDLAQLYDRLASEDDRIRLSAASTLLRKISRPDATSNDEVATVLKRLFRGLCSSRKSARHGFAVALTELLTQISSGDSRRQSFTPQIVIDVLESETQAESNTTGQDERDHYIGRVFGAEAIIRSHLILQYKDRDHWKRLLELLCRTATRKPWLRQECGWVLFEFVSDDSVEARDIHGLFTEDIIKALAANKMIRTPEGVAIWIGAEDSHADSDLSGHVWKYGHPLAKKYLGALAQIMRDARPEDADDEDGVQGAAMWSPKHHFAWNVLIMTLIQYEPAPGNISIEDLWQGTVEQSLFAIGASKERKQNGLSVWKEIIGSLPPSVLPDTLTPNAVRCLISGSTAADKYLRKSCQMLLRTLEGCGSKRPGGGFDIGARARCVSRILGSSDFVDFDKETKSKVVQNFLEGADDDCLGIVHKDLTAMLESMNREDATQAIRKSKSIVDCVSRVFSVAIRRRASATPHLLYHTTEGAILHSWSQQAFYSGPLAGPLPVPRDYIKERLSNSFDQALRAGGRGRYFFEETMRNIAAGALVSHLAVPIDKSICDTVNTAGYTISKSLKTQQDVLRTETSAKTDGSKLPPSFEEGLVMLRCLLILDVLSGEAEAADILRELHSIKEEPQLISSMTEALLSMASRQSKLMRTATTLIFQSMVSKIDKTAIESFIRVLMTKENIKGQQDMFDATNEDEEASDGSDVEMDSDVEVVEASDSDSDDSSESEFDANETSSEAESDTDVPLTNGTSHSSDPSEGDEEKDDELAKFDAALASALGTNNDPDASTSSDSDASMSDSEMFALDAKLTEVFRARKDAAQTNKKKEQKDARENIINFKNRVLDLVEVYVKQQHLNPLVLEFVLPILEMVRTTNTKQLADRGCGVLKELSGKCKGWSVPVIEVEMEDEVRESLKIVHVEAGRDSSNAHKAVASSMSILLVKALVNSGMSIGLAVDVYAGTMTRFMIDKDFKVVPAFFTDWNNWCVSARQKLTK